MEFAQFILEHEADDPVRLALARDRYRAEVEDFDLAVNTLESRRKLRTKVPEWYALPQLRYPLKLSAEQCSSTETARYKACVALSVVESEVSWRSSERPAGPGTFADAKVVEGEKAAGDNRGQSPLKTCKIADLTGGLGVDSWAFAQVFPEVLYNEMNPVLADAALYNFRQLGLDGVSVRSQELRPGNLSRILGDFRPDILFLDPARRAEDGRKVFRLEDCQPDVLQLLPDLFGACPRLLLKLSPMADITLVCKQLKNVKDVHVVAAEGECKELLLLLERDYDGPYGITIYESGAVMEVTGGWGPESAPAGHDVLGGVAKRRLGDITSPSFLFEPGKALLKAGAFDVPCRYGLSKLGHHTHLYTSASPVPEALQPFGKVFEILEISPLNNRSIKDIGKRYPSAEVTARNIPISSDELHKKLGVRSGGSIHIFGCTAGTERLLLVAVRHQAARGQDAHFGERAVQV